YTVAGVTGVVADNLAAVNAAINAQASADTVAEIQTIVDGVIATIGAIDIISTYAGDDVDNAAPTEDIYAVAGVTGVVADNLAAVNAAINAEVSADTVAEIQTIVDGVNYSPIITSTAGTDATEDVEYTYNATATDADDDNASLTWALSGEPDGMKVDTNTGAVTWTPENGVPTSGAVTLTVTGGEGASDTEVFTIAVTAVNDPPVANNYAFTIDEDTSVMVVLSGEDIEGDELSCSVLTQPASGVLSGTAPNLTYLPDSNFYGDDSFTFKVNDGLLDSEIATVSITIVPINDLEAVDDSYTISANTSSTLTVLENDNDPEGGFITLSSATASHGVVEIVVGELLYTPPENFTGTVIIEYLIRDADGGYDTAIVILNVVGNGEGPTLIPPATVWVDANGLYTKVELGVASAFDSLDNAIPVTLVRENSYFKPGVNYALWEAIDSDGNVIVAEQLVYVRPLIS
ncbi:MAG: tandem-95 repeat protein, partial [Gammaproteobacteria bacterium]|nr:tandem-95 repeat protein [Gammaproteobacteria bacterium]